MAIGSFGLRPGPSVRRIGTWPSVNGVSHDESAKRSKLTSSGYLSTLEMHRFMEVGLWGGAIESAAIRPMDGLFESLATFDGTSESSA